MNHWSDVFIERFEPCDDAVAWMRTQPSAADAWATCERGDWMLWALDRLTEDRKRLVLCCCDVAEPALIHVPAGETRPAEALRVARSWARGEGATIKEVRAAAWAAAWAAARAAGAASLKASADIVRRHYPEPPVFK